MAVKSLHQASRCLGELAALVPNGVQLRGFGPDKNAEDLCKGVAGYDYEPEDVPADLLSQVRELMYFTVLHWIVLYCTLMHRTARYGTSMHCVVLD